MVHCLRLTATDGVPKGGAPNASIVASSRSVADSGGIADSGGLADSRSLSGPAGIAPDACVKNTGLSLLEALSPGTLGRPPKE
jgi:hypothetical protein